MKSLTKRKSLMGFIYALIMLLPFSAILVRCLYVTFNKNAYQSYSQTEIEQNYRVNDISQYASGLKYTITKTDTPPSSNGNYRNLTYFSLTASDLNIEQSSYNTITKWILLNNGQIIFCDDNNSWIARINFGNSSATINSFEFIGDVGSEMFSYIITYTSYRTQPLDNAFDYSLYTFLNENGSGRLNLTDWFTDIFLNRTTHNMLYLNYINWYMNYSLLVSCVYLLYSVLMWFLTFARYVINKPLKEEE